MRYAVLSPVLLLGALLSARAALPSYEHEVRHILAEYCHGCHSAREQKGDLDLEQFLVAGDLHKHPKIWESVLEQLELGEMPPKKEAQPSSAEKEKLLQWTRGLLAEMALVNAGDPGPVVLRRLSNMEYTYTVRDLTGLPNLDPTHEFPVDGAAGEGFTNAAAALVMSPALLTKYMDAAKEIASHMVLLQDGIRFSSYTTPSDWTEETLRRIRGFYARYTEGKEDDATSDGKLPIAKYLTSLWKERDLLRQGKKTPEAVSAEQGLNPKYTSYLWAGLNNAQPSIVMDKIRYAFNSTTEEDGPSKLVQTVQAWQQSLWRFASVGHIGKKNGPKGWQEEVSPLGLEHSIRIKLQPPSHGSQWVSVYLVMHGLDDGDRDFVQWDDARIIGKDRKEVMLQNVMGALPPKMTSQVPAVLEVKVPSAIITGEVDFAITARLAPHSRDDACVQVHVLTESPKPMVGLMPSYASSGLAKGTWSDNNLRSSHSAPILVNPASAIGRKLESAFSDFRKLFPLALCYTKIVPTDEIVTLTLFYREDEQLKRLMLNETEIAEIDRLWNELRFISEAPLKQVDVFEQLWQYATQDAKPEAFEPMREPILREAALFKELQANAGATQVQAIIDFAAKAWRRPLRIDDEKKLKALYQTLREQDVPHAEAMRMLLARVLVAPAFLYRGDKVVAGAVSTPVDDWELAARLSYFLWSSTPDEELITLASQGRLHDSSVLAAQVRRMLRDDKVRRLATEFGCQWLQVRDVAVLNEKSERHFPTFSSLREAMQEETVRFFMDLLQQDRSVLSLVDADHTFVNGPLAAHYGIPVKSSEWQRVEGVREKGRGGVLGFAATLSKQSGASRTSPILRGTWLSEAILGDRLPNPPKGVPVLPEEPPAGLTERELIERHSSDERCASCHRRIDPFGFALEGFDAIGRLRVQDSAGKMINAAALLPDGTRLEGLGGLKTYLLTARRDDFVRQFCRKLLGYALGRGVQLSDQPLIEQMMRELKEQRYQITAAVETIVLSPQFRQVRGRDFVINR